MLTPMFVPEEDIPMAGLLEAIAAQNRSLEIYDEAIAFEDVLAGMSLGLIAQALSELCA